MSKTVQVINGPNLGRLGRREPDVYGDTTHEQLAALIEREAADLGLKAVVRLFDPKAVVLEDGLVELACFGVVLDDENDGGAGRSHVALFGHSTGAS